MKALKTIMSMIMSVLIVMSMVLPRFTVTASVDPDLIFEDDFEDYTGTGIPPGWLSHTANATLLPLLSSAEVDADHGRSVRMTLYAAGLPAGGSLSIGKTFTAITTGQVKISYELMKTTTNTDGALRFSNAAGTSAAFTALNFNNQGKIVPLNPDKPVDLSYTTGKWYKVDVILNIDAKSAVYYIDGKEIARGSNYTLPPFERVSFWHMTYRDADLYIDNVSVRYYTPPPEVKAKISFKNGASDVESLLGLTSQDTLAINADIENTTGEDQEITIFCGIYSEGKLIDVKQNRFDVLSTETNITKTLDVGLEKLDDMDKLKAFVWSSANNAPLGGAVSIDKSRHYKILSLGNSFSRDAMRYLHDIAAADGVKLTAVYLSKSGCTLQEHWDYLENNTRAYLLGINGPTGQTVTAKEILDSNTWDFITLQQSSPLSGMIETYFPYIENIAKYLKEAQPQAELIIHQTWAYEKGYPGLLAYDNDQTTMYNAIVTAYNQAATAVGLLTLGDDSEVSPGKAPLRIIPCGTAFKNAMVDPTFDTTYGDGKTIKLYDDGFHASVYGSYLLGAVWYECLTGNNISSNSFCPPGVGQAELDILKSAAHFAVTEYGWR